MLLAPVLAGQQTDAGRRITLRRSFYHLYVLAVFTSIEVPDIKEVFRAEEANELAEYLGLWDPNTKIQALKSASWSKWGLTSLQNQNCLHEL
jgi:hypothetical protein